MSHTAGTKDRWRSNWLVIRPEGAVRIDAGAGRRRRVVALRDTRVLPEGTPVVLTAAAPGARRRCRHIAAAAGVAVEREYLAFPSPAAPAYLVQDDAAGLGVFLRDVLAVPPGAPLPGAAGAALGLARRAGAWRALRIAAPGRVVVGRRV
jgi:hypothetical protein